MIINVINPIGYNLLKTYEIVPKGYKID
jgi:hypothetical protein